MSRREAFEAVKKLRIEENGSFSCRPTQVPGEIQVASFYKVFNVDPDRLSRTCREQRVTFGGNGGIIFTLIGPQDAVCSALRNAQTQTE